VPKPARATLSRVACRTEAVAQGLVKKLCLYCKKRFTGAVHLAGVFAHAECIYQNSVAVRRRAPPR